MPATDACFSLTLVTMAFAHADATYRELKDRLAEHLRGLFPVSGSKRTLVLTGLEIRDNLDPGDYSSQREARLSGASWSVPVVGSFELKEGGKVIDRARIKILDLPRLTNRGTYIVSGTEYAFPIQKRLRSGPYVRYTNAQELVTNFNLAKGKNFDIGLHPTKGHFQLRVDSSQNIPLYPILKTLGVSDDDMVKAWGREVYAANRVDDTAVTTKALTSAFEKLSYGKEPPEDVAAGLRELFSNTKMDEKNVELTLGRGYSSVSGRALLDATVKMLRVGRGEVEEDNRDSLIHNDIVDLADFVVERFKDFTFRSRITRTLLNNIDRRDKISQIISRDAFQRPVDSLMTESQLSRAPTQTNPLGMISDYTAVTVRGEGGVSDEMLLHNRALRALDPSHLGFLDPAHTPEGQGVGTTLHLTTNTRKRGRDLVTRVWDVAAGKPVELTPAELWRVRVAFPESFTGNGLVNDKTVRVSERGEIHSVPRGQVQYVFMNPRHLLDVNTSAVPFTSHNNGARVMLASKMGVQAKPLAEPDVPLVQVALEGGATVERAVGRAFSPKSPVAGKVEKVTEDSVVISGHKVPLPNYFPLNANNFLHATPRVKVGDKVSAGQVLADTNYTKNGDLALGKNLLVAYTPFKGMNVEDGVVVSESAAKKMTSEHMYQQSYPYDTDTVLDLKRFRTYFPAKITENQASKLDDNGVIKKGQEVKPGDILVASMRRRPMGTETQRAAAVSKILAKEWRDDSLTWTKSVPGVVVDVAKRHNEVMVLVRTAEPMRVGDKLVGRYGNKGIVVHILPDSEMPRDEKGRVIDLLLNPNGVVSRMNLGQILETTASRVAEKTGKPFASPGFGDDATKVIAAELKKNGLKDHETIFDPQDNAKIPGVLVGRQYIYKLEHQAEKKATARGGGVGEVYSGEQQPSQGQGVGGRAIGNMELYALLAHGALANVDEMYGVKSNFDPEVWRAIESGTPLPPRRPSYAQKKFLTLLQGMGVKVDRRGDDMVMLPFLDRDVKKLSAGEIKTFKLLRGKDLKEEKGGLFDPKVTGGVQGDRWSHMRLPEPIPNPTFEKAILSLLHMTKAQFDEILASKGGAEIKKRLAAIDVKKRISEIEKAIIGKSGAELNALHRELRFLRALRDNKIKPEEYVIEYLPVLPPQFRPVYTMPDGNLNVSHVNFHYQAVAQVADQLRVMQGKQFASQRRRLASELYKGVGGLMGVNEGIVERPGIHGIAQQLGGAGSPKGGFVHGRLFKRRQDVSATSVIVANPELGLDEVGVPEQLAWKTFAPFVVKELTTMGMKPLEAREAMDKKTEQARQALAKVISEKHVILNRAPTLHKFSVMAFKPRLVSGYALQIPPLVVGGFNADFDGDTMAIHVPVSAQANAEAAKMLPSKHLYKPGSGALQPKIEHEYVLGLFKITRPGRVTTKRFSSTGEVVSALNARRIEPDDMVSVTGIGSTTPGRVLVNEVLPREVRDYGLVFTDKAIQQKLVEIDKTVGREAFVKALKGLADIGRRFAYVTGSSFLLSDLQSMTRERNAAYRRADAEADRVRRSSMSEEDKRKAIVNVYMSAGAQLQKSIDLGKNSAGKSNNVQDMMAAGARGNPSQVKQMVSDVGVMLDHRNMPMPVPVRGSYAEGLSTSEFFQHMYGNRKGMIDRSQSVRDPGALTKQVIVSAAGYRVTMPDCQTRQGIDEPTMGMSALDRYSAETVPGVVKRDELVTTTVLAAARKANVKTIRVRSPLSCEAPSGVCVRCYGLDEEGKPPTVGDFVGIKDAQGLTEPTTQLAMKTFHTGGVATTKANLATGFDRVKQLFTMPKEMEEKATLAEVAGRVDDVRSSPYGGHVVTIGGKNHRVARGLSLRVRVGDQVTVGQQISDGAVDPRDVLRLRGLRAMQVQLRDDIAHVYASGGERLHPKVVEAPVRILTETVRVSDPGDHPSLVAGDYATYGQVDAWNKANRGQKPVVYSHVLPGAESLPHKGDDWAKRMAHNRIGQVLQEAPAAAARAPLKGGSPFAALLFEQPIDRPGGLTHG